MTRSLPPTSPPAGLPAGPKTLTRRHFLAGLGLLAGGGLVVPALRRAQHPSVASVEAGRPLLGTWVRVVARHPDRARATRAVERAFAAVREVDGQMSVHRADSELSRVNRGAGRGPERVSPALLDVVARACDCARRSGGAYDPTVLPLMTLYGFYGPARADLPVTAEVDRALAAVAFEDVRLDRAAGTIALAREGMGLDLGSIGKGWAVDRAADALRAEGVTSGLVDAGGNVYGLGAPDEGAEGWSVALFHPRSGRAERVFQLRDAAVATSANHERSLTVAGRRLGHILDARRGGPADGHVSVSVTARTGVESDAMSTAAFLLGPDRFRGWPGALDTLFL